MVNKYQHLIILKENGGDHTFHVWVKRGEGGAEAMGVWSESNLSYANELAAMAKKPGYFFCSSCKQVLTGPRASVFAGYYCERCQGNEEVKALLLESQRPGFYD